MRSFVLVFISEVMIYSGKHSAYMYIAAQRPCYNLCVMFGCYWFFTVALWNRADHYIFALWFRLLSSSFLA